MATPKPQFVEASEVPTIVLLRVVIVFAALRQQQSDDGAYST